MLIQVRIRLEGCGGRFVEPTRIETGTWSIVKGSWMRRSATGLREVERRNYPRTDVRIVVSYRGNDIAGGYDISESENISPGGMLLATSRAFPPPLPMSSLSNLSPTLPSPFSALTIHAAMRERGGTGDGENSLSFIFCIAGIRKSFLLHPLAKVFFPLPSIFLLW